MKAGKKTAVFYISEGRVHTIEAWLLAAEIQQSSSIIFQILDHNRVDAQIDQ